MVFILSRYLHNFLKNAHRNSDTVLRKIHNSTGCNSRLARMGAFSSGATAANRDAVPNGFALIYRAPLGNYLSSAKNITAASATFIVALTAYQYSQESNAVSGILPEIEYGKLVAHEGDLKYFALGFVTINLIMQIIVAKTPLRIYRNAENYIGIYNSKLPFRDLQKHYFKKGEVAEIRSIFNPWREIYFRVGQKKSFLMAHYFKTPAEFNEMQTI